MLLGGHAVGLYRWCHSGVVLSACRWVVLLGGWCCSGVMPSACRWVVLLRDHAVSLSVGGGTRGHAIGLLVGGVTRGSCRVSAQDLGTSESPRGQAAGRVCWFLQCLQRSYRQNAEYPSRLKKCLPAWVWERHCCSFQSEDFVLIRVFKGFVGFCFVLFF